VGFTLLEVMIALAILGMSLVIISRSHQNSVRAANRAKLMSVAVMLARYMMVDVEDKLFEEGFSEFEEEDKGDFKDEGFDRYTYTLKVDKVELPADMNKDSVEEMLGGLTGSSSDESSSSSSSSESSTNPMQALGSKVLSSQFEMIRNVLEQAIRRVQLSVEWKEGSRTKAVTVVGYFTDPRKVDMAASGQLTTGGATSANPDSSATGNTMRIGGISSSRSAVPNTRKVGP